MLRVLAELLLLASVLPADPADHFPSQPPLSHYLEVAPPPASLLAPDAPRAPFDGDRGGGNTSLSGWQWWEPSPSTSTWRPRSWPADDDADSWRARGAPAVSSPSSSSPPRVAVVFAVNERFLDVALNWLIFFRASGTAATALPLCFDEPTRGESFRASSWARNLTTS